MRNSKGVQVDHFGERKEYEVLKLIEFNSTRKRMSVIARMPDGIKSLIFWIFFFFFFLKDFC